jgi:hypothetical protein
MNWYQKLREIGAAQRMYDFNGRHKIREEFSLRFLEVKRVCSPHSYNIEKRCDTARRQIFMGSIKLQKGRGIRRGGENRRTGCGRPGAWQNIDPSGGQSDFRKMESTGAAVVCK